MRNLKFVENKGEYRKGMVIILIWKTQPLIL